MYIAKACSGICYGFMGQKNVVCNTVNNYHVAGIIDEAFNLTIW